MSQKVANFTSSPQKMCFVFLKVSVLVGFVDPLIFRQTRKLRLPEDFFVQFATTEDKNYSMYLSDSANG